MDKNLIIEELKRRAEEFNMTKYENGGVGFEQLTNKLENLRDVSKKLSEMLTSELNNIINENGIDFQDDISRDSFISEIKDEFNALLKQLILKYS